MKIMGTLLTMVLFLLLGTAVPAFSQQEQKEDEKPKQEEPKAEPKPGEPRHAAPAERREEGRPAQEPQREEQDRRVQQEQQNRHQENTNRTQQEQQKQDHDRAGQAQNQDRHEEQGEHRDDARQGGERRHARIPDDRFRGNFGREHHFHISQRPVIVEGAPRFQYSGYWFELAQPWPGEWVYTDDFFIDYIDGDYYMFDPRFPEARILVYVIE